MVQLWLIVLCWLSRHKSEASDLFAGSHFYLIVGRDWLMYKDLHVYAKYDNATELTIITVPGGKGFKTNRSFIDLSAKLDLSEETGLEITASAPVILYTAAYQALPVSNLGTTYVIPRLPNCNESDCTTFVTATENNTSLSMETNGLMGKVTASSSYPSFASTATTHSAAVTTVTAAAAATTAINKYETIARTEPLSLISANKPIQVMATSRKYTAQLWPNELWGWRYLFYGTQVLVTGLQNAFNVTIQHNNATAIQLQLEAFETKQVDFPVAGFLKATADNHQHFACYCGGDGDQLLPVINIDRWEATAETMVTAAVGSVLVVSTAVSQAQLSGYNKTSTCVWHEQLFKDASFSAVMLQHSSLRGRQRIFCSNCTVYAMALRTAKLATTVSTLLNNGVTSPDDDEQNVTVDLDWIDNHPRRKDVKEVLTMDVTPTLLFHDAGFVATEEPVFSGPVIAVIVTLSTAIFFVGACILGFILNEIFFNKHEGHTSKVTPFA